MSPVTAVPIACAAMDRSPDAVIVTAPIGGSWARRENLYRHDLGVVRLRRLYRVAAEAQSSAGA
ncbi:hypothetical protein G6W57_26375 [Streptomyces sp. CAI-121]|uniref:hypothetical protein n=1 Tax=unclassified Streptomyces TaxID=2593676 RepID=UPI001587059A|nr:MULTISPECIES: hypothetical protein [unclassified Streptomyces]NUV70640.1 hypothetical protein [Streptomyces sp. CAI-121]NUW17450.1 hypothetical protein [Streptomyces sp. CAI-68]